MQDYESLVEKIGKEKLPEDAHLLIFKTHFLLAGFSRHSTTKAPEIEYSIEVQNDCSFSLFRKNTRHASNIISHISKKTKISKISDLLNICAFLKNQKEEAVEKSSLEAALDIMDQALTEFKGEDGLSKKWLFFLEQLKLTLKKKKGRKYSPALLAMAMMWKNTSPALYRQLLEEDMLCLPSVGYLQCLQNAFNFSTGLDSTTKKYLKARVKMLKDFEKLMTCMIDEVHTLQRVEYQNGRLFGLEENSASKTVMAVMVKSLAGSYEDVVALFPVTNLNSKMLKEIYDLVFPAFKEVGITPVAISSDNYTANRKFFKDELCGGTLKPFVLLDKVDNEYGENNSSETMSTASISSHDMPDGENKLFLLFDATHNMKNIYNNFLNKGSFDCPSFEV